MGNWKRNLGICAAVLAGLIVLFLIVVAMQPGEFRITRSAKMQAAPGAVFAEVNDFHRWEAWSPWAKLDPDAKSSFEGPEAGEGAKFSWDGNDKVGAGTQTIVESKPGERIHIRLAFERPMQDTSDVEFTFKPEGEQTLVTWSMWGEQNFMEKAFCMFMNMDKMVGGDFEKGLVSLKGIVEKAGEATSPTGEADTVPVSSQP
jgi:hypothetical protein